MLHVSSSYMLAARRRISNEADVVFAEGHHSLHSERNGDTWAIILRNVCDWCVNRAYHHFSTSYVDHYTGWRCVLLGCTRTAGRHHHQAVKTHSTRIMLLTMVFVWQAVISIAMLGRFCCAQLSPRPSDRIPCAADGTWAAWRPFVCTCRMRTAGSDGGFVVEELLDNISCYIVEPNKYSGWTYKDILTYI